MGCRILFSEYADPDSADEVAAGWRGDRYLVFDQGKELVWKTVWRSPEAVEAATGALEAMCSRRFHLLFVRQGDLILGSNDPAHSVIIQILGANEVVFILAGTRESAQLLNQQFAGAPHG
jgi:hypothetical protein